MAVPESVERSRGEPMLALAVDAPPDWRLTTGDELEIAFVLSNAGGPLSGVYVEVGGAAVDGEAIVAAKSVAAGSGAPVEFSQQGRTARAELPKLSLVAGFVPAKDRKKNPTPPQPSERVVVRLRGERSGNGLLTVRVGPLSSPDTRGSALSGRNVSVE